MEVNKKKVKWKVSVPENLKNDKVKVNYNPCKNASADEDIIITLDDIFNPLSQEIRERLRRLKQKEIDEMLRLIRTDNSCEPEIKIKKYPRDNELFKGAL